MFLGLDSSTQSLTAIVLDPATAGVVAECRIGFGQDLPQFGSPSGFLPDGEEGEVHANPLMWLAALDLLMDRLRQVCDVSKIKAVAGSGQQHGSVYLNQSFETVIGALDASRDLENQLVGCFSRATSPIWMDTSTGQECTEIAAAAGGDAMVCQISGSVAVERFTGPQIRKFFKRENQAYEGTSSIHLVGSFMASVLVGKSANIDFGDGAGMNLMDLASGDWSDVLLDATAPELRGKLPALASATTVLGVISPYFVKRYGFDPDCKCALFTGDNPASLVGMGATEPGNIVISLGTSDTFFAAMESAKTDLNGYGHVFGNPAGGFMSLICFRNGSLAREALRDELGLDWSAFEASALAVTRDSAGENLMLPFYGPEITPRFDFKRPVVRTVHGADGGLPASLQVRALLEGQFLNMRLHSKWMDVPVRKIRLTGGASQNDGIAGLVADVFQAPVERLVTGNSAALGAAMIAAASQGLEFSTLERDFSIASGPVIHPDRSLASTYERAQNRFAELLRDVMDAGTA